MDVDSQRDRKKGLYAGSRMGSIAFNYNATHFGGVCLLGFDKNQGLCQEGDGSVNFAKDVTLNSNSFVAPGRLISFKSNNNANSVYLGTPKNYTEEDKKAGRKDNRGDLFIGT